MTFISQLGWSCRAHVAALCIGLAAGAVRAAEPISVLSTSPALRQQTDLPTSPLNNTGLSIPDEEPVDWMQVGDETGSILLTNSDDVPPAPRILSLETRLMELEQQVNARERESALFRQRQGLPAEDASAEFPQTAAVPPPLEDLVFGANAADKPVVEKKEKPWYEKMKIRGYAQFRYNRLGETNPNLVNTQGDQSIGDNRSFLLRRARMVFSGDINDRVSYYIQPDFASGVGGPNFLHFLQIRDFYADIFLDDEKEFRLRVGQSKVPYAFENLQSSQNRIAFDRADAINSGLVNERDLGVFFYWAPSEIRERFKYLVDSGLKGSGDYGVFAFGAYNGQTANRSELNDQLHIVSRLTYPFQFANCQIFEPGISGYTGNYNVATGTGISGNGVNFVDQRVALSFVLYPQPLGLQGEYTWGQGPEVNAANNAVIESHLEGGYFQVFYKIDEFGNHGKGTLIPYARVQRYDGGRKHETNAPNYRIREAEVGCEYQFSKALELTMAYTWSERTFPTSPANVPYSQEKGGLVRMQLQWNY